MSMKILLFLLLALPVYSQVNVNYDKFKDQTIATSETTHVESLDITVKAMHQGQNAGDVKYYLVFRTSGKEWRYLNSHGLIFMADGERINLGNGFHDGDVKTTRYRVSVSETMIYQIHREDLEKIANSTSLEMKLGANVAQFGPKDKKGMREMLEYK